MVGDGVIVMAVIGAAAVAVAVEAACKLLDEPDDGNNKVVDGVVIALDGNISNDGDGARIYDDAVNDGDAITIGW